MRAFAARDGKASRVFIPDPLPNDEEILVRVHATAVNRADISQVQGLYTPAVPGIEVLGFEFAGEVLDIGERVHRFKTGDRVMALVSGGAYAEKAVVHQEHAVAIPEIFSYEEAAAILVAFLTAYHNIVELGHLLEGERVLIHAGASSIGLAATQIARIIGADVFVTASSDKRTICKEVGAILAIDRDEQDFAQEILAYYSGVHMVLDMVGLPYWDGNLQVLEKHGRLIYIGLMGGKAGPVDFSRIIRKHVTITGSNLDDHDHARRSKLIAEFVRWSLPHFQARRLRPNVWRVMGLDEVTQAFELVSKNITAGKIVLRV